MKIAVDNVTGLKYIPCNESHPYGYRRNFVTLNEKLFRTSRKRNTLSMVRSACHEWMIPFRGLVNIQMNYLKYTGLSKIDTDSSFLQGAYFLYKRWILITMYILAITLFADIYENLDNLSITTDDGCVFAGILVVIFKAMNYQFCWKRMIQLLDRLWKFTDDICEFSDVQEVKDIIDRYYLRNKIIFFGFSALGCVLCVALLLFSPMDNGLPIRAKYPFNTTISPWHEIGFFVEVCAVGGGLVAIVGIDTNWAVISSLITMLFDVLRVNFESCSNRTSNDQIFVKRAEGKLKESRFSHRYKSCLQFHQRLTSMTIEFNEIFSSSVFVQMLSSTSIICLTGFQAVVVGGQNTNVMKFGIYLSAGISQLFYSCWLGNELSNSSSLLDRSQWLSDWHHESFTKIVQMLTLSTLFSRRPISLKAGVFYVLSLETFIAIIKKSYSVYTLLNNMHVTEP